MYICENEHCYPGLVQLTPQDPPRVPPHPCIHNQKFEEKMSKEDIEEPEHRRGKWKSIKRAGTSMKKYLRKKITGSGKGSKNYVLEVNIQQEDDTDYEKQWTRRMRRAQTFDSEGRSCSSGASSAKSHDSEKSRDGARSRSPEDEDDGILVVHDAEDDLDLSL